MQRIGLLAGAGHLPAECAKAAVALGFEVYAVGLLDETEDELESIATNYEKISIGQLDALLRHLKDNDIKQVTMIGKVTKELLFNGKVQPDASMLRLLMSLPNQSDDTVMLAFIDELRKAGMEAFDQTKLIKALMPEKGVLTKREPTESEQKDIEFGFKMAKELGRLDVGQTVVVKNLAVMALEAIEGTDACILRGGELAKGDAVVVKVAKPEQDNRFDVPTVGLKTIESMVKVGAKTLAIEAKETLLVEREKVLVLAEANGISIVAV
ncbi:MAG: UDP-2,3-diacylglucosamine diphosphatase LpxI [Selenomonadaceae bacterium]|nr:UDP-2,3-diacylglucosamine diphosphatase LpxI [Selenomonadaceae bacterium]